MTCAGALFADEVDRFVLPEAPPTIERVEKPSIDRPFLKKQNFIPDADISSSPIWQKTNFKAFDEASFPAWVRVLGGAYRTASVEALYTSRTDYTLSLGHYVTDGETPVLSAQKTFAGFSGETQFNRSLVGDGSFDFLTRSLNGQKKNSYGASSSLSWYPARNFNVTAHAGWVYADVEPAEKNDSFTGGIEGNWQPVDGDNLIMNASATHDTAFSLFSSDYKIEVVNEISLLADMMAGIGARYQDEHAYPNARLVWRPFDRGRFTVSYEPGMVMPDWTALYVADRFVSVNNDLPLSENIFDLKESFSYFWIERGAGTIECYQQRQRNGAYWTHVPVSNTITPMALDDIFRSGCRIKVDYKGTYFRPECDADLTGEKDLPFVPQYSAAVKLGLHYGVFTLTPSVNTVGERRAALNGDIMPAYSAVSCKLEWQPKADVILALEGINLIGETIESQPGFVQHIPTVQCSVEFKF